MSNRYDIIRDHYQFLTPMIIESSCKNVIKWVSPYHGFDWMTMFTPIENQTWQAIRYFGHAPFYPQYPVGNYFVDFGNPFLKIAIECDGAEFHQDKEKDRKRDMVLFESGWIVYRISGSDCTRMVREEYYNIDWYDDEYDKYGILSQFYESTIEGLIKALAIYYFGYKRFYENVNEMQLVIECLDSRVSLKDKIKHQINTEKVDDYQGDNPF